MKEERIGDCRLILGDCLEVMQTLGKVDAVVTDPPWNMDYFTDDKKPWDEYAEWLSGFHAKSLLLSPSAEIVFLSSKAIPYVSHIYRGWQSFAAVKNFSQMSKSKDTIPNAFDIGFVRLRGCYTGKGRNWFKCNTAGMLSDRTGHPTPRTLDAMIQSIEWVDSQTILDPFMGSGTTLVACAKLGRKGIGIEIDPDYFDIACNRVEEAYRQPDLFVAPPAPKPTQEGFDL